MDGWSKEEAEFLRALGKEMEKPDPITPAELAAHHAAKELFERYRRESEQ